MRKILTIIGARPQFVKAATVSRAAARCSDISQVVVHTGQHYDSDMSEIFFTQMDIPEPDYNLGIGGGSHGAMTGRQLEKIEEVLINEKPDCVLVYGDTNSTLAGALAAAKLHIPVAHVEAGLRSFNRRMPEEINRVLTDHISTLLFAPTGTARDNLLSEGIDDCKINIVGDVMFDAALFYKGHAVKPDWFDELGVTNGEFALCTVHRAENTDDADRLNGIFRGLADSGMSVILPLHPRTREKLKKMGVDIARNIHLTGPVGYLEMIWLETHSCVVATDSGGVQKEAFFHSKPCVTLRDETEWVELVELGVNQLAAADPVKIAHLIDSMAKADLDFGARPYGRGDAAVQILEKIASMDLESKAQTNENGAAL